MTPLARIENNARRLNRRIALSDTTDARILAAAREAADRKIARIILIGESDEVQEAARKADVSLDGLETLGSKSYPRFDELANRYYQSRKDKLASLTEAAEEIRANDLLLAALLASVGEVDGVLAGAVSTTGEVIRAALRGIGLADGMSVLSSLFLLDFPKIPGHRHLDRHKLQNAHRNRSTRCDAFFFDERQCHQSIHREGEGSDGTREVQSAETYSRW